MTAQRESGTIILDLAVLGSMEETERVIVVQILLGLSLLLFGRRLPWLFVSVLGFVMGALLASMLAVTEPWLIFLVALMVGVAGVLLAVFVQRFAIIASGFLAGGYVFLSLQDTIDLDLGPLGGLTFAIGGLFGALVVSTFFDWALIVLSVATGATLIVATVDLASPLNSLSFAGLIIAGTIFQTVFKRRCLSTEKDQIQPSEA